MPKGNRRSIGVMAQGAIAQQKDAEIEALRQQLNQLQTTLEDGTDRHGTVEISVDRIVPLQIESHNGRLELIQQPRTYFDAQGIKDLAHSIRANGLREPIVVRELQDGFYGLLDGERRWRAHTLLKAESIRAFIAQDISDSDALEWAIATDTLKEKISPLEQTLAVVNLLRLRFNTDEAGVRATLHALNNYNIGNSSSLGVDDKTSNSVHGVLNSLGLKLGSLVARLPLLDLPEYLRSAVANGKINPTNALLIARTPAELHQRLLEDGSGLSKNNLKKLISSLKSGSTSQVNDVDSQKTIRADSKPLSELVGDRWTNIKHSKLVKSGTDKQLNHKLQKLDALLQEIETYISIQK